MEGVGERAVGNEGINRVFADENLAGAEARNCIFNPLVLIGSQREY